MKIIKSLSFLIVFFLYGSVLQGQEVTIFPSFWGMDFYQDDQELDKKQFIQLLKTNDAAYAHWKKSNTQEILSGVAFAGQVGLLLWGVEEWTRDGVSERDRANAALGPIAGSLVVAVLTGIFMNASNKSKRRAVLTYNKRFDKQTSFRLVPAMNQNGMGIGLRF
jgi:hypothetical protein